MKSVDYKTLAAALSQVRDSPHWWATRYCLLFLVFTGVRNSEARLATWEEINLSTRIWTVPAERMKNKIEHKVPLSVQTMELLLHVQDRTGRTSGLDFPPSTRRQVHTQKQPLGNAERPGNTGRTARIQVKFQELGRGKIRHLATRRRNGLGSQAGISNRTDVHDIRVSGTPGPHHAGRLGRRHTVISDIMGPVDSGKLRTAPPPVPGSPPVLPRPRRLLTQPHWIPRCRSDHLAPTGCPASSNSARCRDSLRVFDRPAVALPGPQGPPCCNRCQKTLCTLPLPKHKTRHLEHSSPS